MQSGLFFPLFDELSDPSLVVQLAVEAEEAGWDGVFVWDHIRWKEPVVDVADPWITLAAVAAATHRIRFGPMVTPLARRRPAKVARETATLDRLGEGRLIFGVGVGSDEFGEEYSLTGEELDARRRAQMLDEALEIVTSAWTGAPVDFQGDFYKVGGMRFRPRPVQERVPIWVAASYGKRKPLERAARYDGLFPVNLEGPDQLAELASAARALRHEAGVDPEAPYDVIASLEAGVDPAPYAAAGATWWLVESPSLSASAAQIRDIIRNGPVG